MRGLTFAIALVAAGCGGSGAGGAHDFNGTYRADTHTEDKAGCGDGAAVGDQAIFKLEYGSLIAVAGYKYELCTSVDACLDFGILSLLFTDQVADGWNDDSYDATSSGDGCVLSHMSGTLRVAGSDGARVEFRKYSLMSGVAASDCTTATARAQSATMPCVDHEVLVATRVK